MGSLDDDKSVSYISTRLPQIQIRRTRNDSSDDARDVIKFQSSKQHIGGKAAESASAAPQRFQRWANASACEEPAVAGIRRLDETPRAEHAIAAEAE